MIKPVGRRLNHIVTELILCSVTGLFSQLPVLATQNVVLAWIPSSSTNVVGYRIYYGTASLDYCSQVTVGSTNTAPFIFTDTNAVSLQQCFYQTFCLPP